MGGRLRGLLVALCLAVVPACASDGQPNARLAELANAGQGTCPVSGADETVIGATTAQLVGVAADSADDRHALTCDWGGPASSPALLTLTLDGIGDLATYDGHEVLESQNVEGVRVEVSAREDAEEDLSSVAQQLIELASDELRR